MSLKHRVIICLLINDGVLFRTKKFTPDYRYTANFVGAGSVDEIIMVDITRSGPSEASKQAMAAFAEKCFVPITMGGHIKSLDDVKKYMDIGADKVVVGRGALEDLGLVTQIDHKFGRQAAVVACDVLDGNVCSGADNWESFISPENWAGAAESAGAGEIFLQSVERDGSLSGYDLETLKSVVAAVKIPVVVGTSCGSAQHMREAFEAGASGAATANIFHFTETSMRGFKQQLVSAGVAVRP
jgi:imidazole glycerol-phosphate synthase subunit HisF